MTTDTVPKTATAAVRIRGVEHTVGGMAKGSGMVHPDMATMLALVTTDAPVAPGALGPLVGRVADDTLNCVTVDGDCSTNDTLLVLANGVAGGEPLTDGSAGLGELEEAIRSVCDSLAEQLAADGEGATKHFRVEVLGAEDTAQARLAARTVAASPLVKTAIHGADPNWGRIVMALGRSGASLVLDRLRVRIGDRLVFDRGAPLSVDLDAVRAIFAQSRIDISCDLGVGERSGHAWGCDLTAEYVRINAEYTT